VRTAVVVNANAAAFVRDPGLAASVRRAARGAGRVVVTHSLEELAAAAQEMKRVGTGRVVLCGGDGTFMAGVSALVAAGLSPLPEICFAPGGTVATVARNLGERRDLIGVVRSTASGEPRPTLEQPTLAVSEHHGSLRVGFIVGTGLVARFFQRYYAAGGGGYATAARIVARVFVGSFVSDAYSRSVLDPLPCTLSVDGRELEPRAYSLVVSSVVRDLGLHMRVTHRAGEDPERPHLVASPLPPRALGPQAPRVLLGRKLRGRGCFDDLVGELTIRFPEGPGPYVLDGDLLAAEAITVRAGPRLRVALS
jgi:diacylglycerol kinase family enzyme